MPIEYTVPHQTVNARDPASKPLLLQGALEGHVLVKNTNNALPLNKPQMLSIFGYDAIVPPEVDVGSGGEYSYRSFGTQSTLDLGTVELFESGEDADIPQIGFNGTLISGGEKTHHFYKEESLTGEQAEAAPTPHHIFQLPSTRSKNKRTKTTPPYSGISYPAHQQSTPAPTPASSSSTPSQPKDTTAPAYTVRPPFPAIPLFYYPSPNTKAQTISPTRSSKT